MSYSMCIDNRADVHCSGIVNGKPFSIDPTVGILATALGLTRSDDLALVASDVGFVEALARAADAELIGKEMAVLERMLADPPQHQPDGWLSHLPNRPEVIAPLAGRIFAALRALQTSDLSASENGRNLWRLAAALPPGALASHRADMIDMLQPGQARG
ncbi:hypothetical protein [Sphingomonas endolithica]|uniref:hypothetical protein n=1 Tax=Sphingomonas endolithica TaxID=2972485 RepID=UPI0021B05662|nr:hypothetical protein [Sphingomonas sp. ZFBP2030]